jgi:hypothetical protein
LTKLLSKPGHPMAGLDQQVKQLYRAAVAVFGIAEAKSPRPIHTPQNAAAFPH